MKNDMNTNKDTAQELFKQFIETRYNNAGPQSALILRTSRELAYDCREMCEPSLPDINKTMVDLGYKAQQFMDSSAWVLYEKDELRY